MSRHTHKTRTTTTVSVHLSGTCYFSYADATLDMPSTSVYISPGASGAISSHIRCHCDEAGSYYADIMMYTTKLSQCGETVRRRFTYMHCIIMVCQHRRQCRRSSHRRRWLSAVKHQQPCQCINRLTFCIAHQCQLNRRLVAHNPKCFPRSHFLGWTTVTLYCSAYPLCTVPYVVNVVPLLVSHLHVCSLTTYLQYYSSCTDCHSWRTRQVVSLSTRLCRRRSMAIQKCSARLSFGAYL